MGSLKSEAVPAAIKDVHVSLEQAPILRRTDRLLTGQQRSPLAVSHRFLPHRPDGV